jgi:predicted transcriptional regulator
MALSYAVRKQLLAASLPESTEVRLELQDYLARTGMAPSDFARRINYARETVYQFLNGHYSRISSNDGLIRTAIRDFIAAHPIAAPAISSGKLYETENARLLRQYFYEALDHEPEGGGSFQYKMSLERVAC